MQMFSGILLYNYGLFRNSLNCAYENVVVCPLSIIFSE